MSNLHELTKQLDVLTWNSRSVLNALVRSAMAAGSNEGFTVTRAGEKVVMTKMDIFAVYHFYEEWEAEGYSSGDAFYELVDKHNKQYEGDEVVTQALMKHSQIMWLDSSNVANKDNVTFWLDKIADSTNPKWLTNTAPIPLNIRTPIYDENLSTKTYDSYETYLFPSGYYSIDTLGYRGDGTSHSGGGKDWVFDVDDKYQILAKRVLIGDQSPATLSLYQNFYDMTRMPGNALEGGENCYALADNAISYGDGNVVAGYNSVILGGRSNAIYRGNSNCGILAGTQNDIFSHTSAICAGNHNSVGGRSSLAANSSNHVGGYPYFFQRSVRNNDSETECIDPFLADNGCLYTRADTGTASSADGAIQLSALQIYITDEVRVQSAISNNRISVGDSQLPYSPFDFKVGDPVCLFEFSVRDDAGNTVPLGNAVLFATVTGIDAVTEKMTGTGGSSKVVGYIISLNKNVTASNIPDLGNRAVQSGQICRSSAQAYPCVDNQGKLAYEVYGYGTRDCTVFGYNNIAAGEAQTVVGASSYELLKPRFIVGSGSSYVQLENQEDHRRDVSLVSAQHYTYQKATQYIVAGVSSFTTAYIHGDHNFEETEELRRYDEDYEGLHVEKYAGFYAYSIDNKSKDDLRAVLRVFHKNSLFVIGDNGLKLREPSDTQTNSVLNELYSRHGSIAIHADDDKTAHDWYGYHKSIADPVSPVDERAITVWANGMVGIHGGHIRLDSEDGLTISGPTRHVLTAQPTADELNPFDISDESAVLDLVTGTGHYYVNKLNSGWSANDGDFGNLYSNSVVNAFHIFESSKSLGNNSYDIAQIILPGNLSPTCTRALRGSSAMPHPAICVTHVDGVMNTRRASGTSMIAEELAYMSDVQRSSGATVCENRAVLGYVMNDFRPEWTYSDGLNEVAFAGNSYYVLDPFLAGLASTSTSYAETGSAYAITSSLPHIGKFVHAKSFSGAALSAAKTYADTKPFYLNGVMINPMMYMTARDREDNTVDGMGYLAYGPATVAENVAINFTGTQQQNIYTAQLSTYTPATNWSQNLSTSGYCTGTTGSVYPNNLRDVWATLIVGGDLWWIQIMKDFHVTFAGGRLSIEFWLSGYAMTNGKYLPATNDAEGYVKPKSSSPDDDDIIRKHNLLFNLPLDPTIGNHLINAMNVATGVTAQMYGHIYHTVDEIDHIDLTGIYSTQQSMPKYDFAVNPTNLYGYTAPQVQIMFRSTESDFHPDAWYRCHLEGAVSYVN